MYSLFFEDFYPEVQGKNIYGEISTIAFCDDFDTLEDAIDYVCSKLANYPSDTVKVSYDGCLDNKKDNMIIDKIGGERFSYMHEVNRNKGIIGDGMRYIVVSS